MRAPLCQRALLSGFFLKRRCAGPGRAGPARGPRPFSPRCLGSALPPLQRAFVHEGCTRRTRWLCSACVGRVLHATCTKLVQRVR